MAQLRKAADRKRVHRGDRTPMSLQAAAADVRRSPTLDEPAPESNGAKHRSPASRSTATARSWSGRRRTPRVPMTLDQALHEMELVGHDFYLFIDAEHDAPSVVYRRRAYDYGVIRLASAARDVASAASRGP